MSTDIEIIALRDEATRPALLSVNGLNHVELVVVHACWLSIDKLFLVLKSAEASDSIEAFAHCERNATRLAARGMVYERPGETSSRRLAKAVLLRLPPGHTKADSLGVTLRTGGLSLSITALELLRVTVGLEALLRLELAALGAVERAGMLAFMAGGPGELETPRSLPVQPEFCCAKAADRRLHTNVLQFSKSLYIARQAMRERLTGCVISVTEPQGLNIDTVLAIDEHSFYVKGWIRDEEAPPTRLTAVSPEGCRRELLPSLYRHSRPDVEEFYNASPSLGPAPQHGWIANFELPVPSVLACGWIFEMENAAGSEIEAMAPAVTRDLATIRDVILRDLSHERLPAQRLRVDHIAPALDRLERRRRSLATVESVDHHGQPPAKPDVSIVVPLYGRTDFVEQQMAQFADDPDLQGTDLIYVLDSPSLAEQFRAQAGQLAELYRVPFRAVVLSHNVGFSTANNIGADMARGRLLVLLNSDVFPRKAGWVSAMSAFYDDTAGIGALGPKLLYEDDSIQHAGMYFRRLSDTGTWSNEHYFKGLHRDIPAANVVRPVPAVTGACLLIDAALYREIGGLRGTYVQGDFEDSDLCLRLRTHGHQNWYLPTVELYHLEAQSYPSQIRQLTGTYNRWLHAHLWKSEIATIEEALQ